MLCYFYTKELIMKKIYILLLLSVFSFLLITNTGSVYALENEDYIIDHEIGNSFFSFYTNINYDQDPMFITLDKIFFKQNAGADFVFRGYHNLLINQKNQYEIELDNSISSLEFFDTDQLDNVKALYFLLEFNNLNTVDGSFRGDSGITHVNDKTLKYVLNPAEIYNLNHSIFFNVWFADRINLNEPVSTAGQIRMTGIKLILEFKEPVSTLKHVAGDYSLLPEINKEFIQLDSMEAINVANKSYTLFFKHNKLTYAFDFAFPTDVDISKIVVGDKLNISYSVDPKNKDRLLYIQPDPTKKAQPLKYGTIEDPAQLMVGFTVVNLTQQKYETVKQLELKTIVQKEANRNAYMYAFTPLQISEILNITVEYQYRYKYFIFNSPWYKVENYYAHDDSTRNSFMWWNYLTINAVPAFTFNVLNVYRINTIKKIGINDVSENVKNEYLTFENANILDLQDMTKYKIHLGQFDEFGSTKYDITKHSVIHITYVYKGTVYSVPAALINQENIDPPTSSTLGELDFKGFLSFKDVNDLASFLGHIARYWQETIITVIAIILLLLFIRVIMFVIPRRRMMRN